MAREESRWGKGCGTGSRASRHRSNQEHPGSTLGCQMVNQQSNHVHAAALGTHCRFVGSSSHRRHLPRAFIGPINFEIHFLRRCEPVHAHCSSASASVWFKWRNASKNLKPTRSPRVHLTSTSISFLSANISSVTRLPTLTQLVVSHRTATLAPVADISRTIQSHVPARPTLRRPRKATAVRRALRLS